jgi:phosphoribosylformylglycinamidine synthase
VIGMVGRLPDARMAGRLGFLRAGEQIALVGPFAPSLAASELDKLRGKPLPDGLPNFDIEAVRAAQVAIRDAVRSGALSSAHDVAEGGMAIALAECCLAGSIGAEVALGDDMATLFGEGVGGFVVSGSAEALRELAAVVAVRVIGSTVASTALTISRAAGRPAEITITLGELSAAHNGLAEMFS